MTPIDPIRAALERAARELELSAIALRQSDFETFAKRAQNEAHAARAALAKEQGEGADAGNVLDLAGIIRHVDGGHRLGAAALAEAILLHPDIGLVLANSEGPAVLESREPASVADHNNPIQEALNKLEEYDQANPYHDCRDLIAAARVALARWGHQPARLRNCPTHGQQPPQAWGCPECVRQLREELAAARLHQPATPLEVKGASDEEFRQLYCDIFDLRCDPSSTGPVPVKFARAVLARYGHQPAPPAEGDVAELAHASQIVTTDFRALCAEVIAYNEGQGPYNFTQLNGEDRDNAAYDAWVNLRDEIKSALAATANDQS